MNNPDEIKRLASNLTESERLIIDETVRTSNSPRKHITELYLLFRAGASLPHPATEWVRDLWREAQERKQFHIHQTG